MAASFNSATNTITVTGGTTATPLTLADVLAADAAARGTRNLLTYSETLSNAAWTKRGTAASLAAVSGPMPVIGGWQTTVAAVGVNDVYQIVSSLTTGARYEPSFWVKRVNTSGILYVGNPQNSTTSGKWSIDLSLLSNEWERITRSHRAVTVIVEFVGLSSSCGLHFYATAGSPVAVNLAAPQLESAYPDRVVVSGTLSPDAAGVYVATGTWNGLPAYKRESDGAYWRWWNGSAWITSALLGVNGSAYWSGAVLVGSNSPLGTATGTATVSQVYERLTVSGTLSPNVVDAYVRAGEYNKQPYYASATTHDNGSGTAVTWYVRYYAAGAYRLTTSLTAGDGTPLWANFNLINDQSADPYSGATGTATVAADTASGQNTISDYQKSGWGVSSQPLAGVNHADLAANLAIGDGVTATNADLSAWDLNLASGKTVTVAANAQVRYAVRLKIVDQQGAPLHGATVTLTNAASQQVWQVTTGADGLVAQTAWTGGNPHRLTVAAAGKETLTMPGVVIAGNSDWTVEVIDEVFTAQDRLDLQATKADAATAKVDAAAAKTAAEAAKTDAAAIRAHMPLDGTVAKSTDVAVTVNPTPPAELSAESLAAVRDGLALEATLQEVLDDTGRIPANPAAVGSEMVASNFVAAPTPAAIRQEMDANSAKLAAIAADAAAAKADAAETQARMPETGTVATSADVQVTVTPTELSEASLEAAREGLATSAALAAARSDLLKVLQARVN